MSLGDYRDGSAISFTPNTRSSSKASRVIGSLLLVGALGVVGFGFYSQQTSVPLRNDGKTAVGVLTGYSPAPRGGYAMVEYPAGSSTKIARSENPVPTDRQRQWGAVYQVRYDGRHTFIEGIDPLIVPWDAYLGGAALGLTGLALTIFPVKLRARD